MMLTCLKIYIIYFYTFESFLLFGFSFSFFNPASGVCTVCVFSHFLLNPDLLMDAFLTERVSSQFIMLVFPSLIQKASRITMIKHISILSRINIIHSPGFLSVTIVRKIYGSNLVQSLQSCLRMEVIIPHVGL